MVKSISKRPLEARTAAVQAAKEKHAGRSVPLSRIQKLIGQRMVQSKMTKPCFYIGLDADVTELMSLRRKLSRKLCFKITTNSLYIFALARAAREYPLMLSRLNGDDIKIAGNINVAFAVNAPEGIIVPVIKDADSKELVEIASLEKSLTNKARCNKLTLEQMQDQTIALSNLGPYGIDSFFGIVPPTTTTILATGNVLSRPVPSNGSIQVRKMICLTLATDSRVVGSVYAARFLNLLKENLQKPIHDYGL
ncbi:MAG: 2-oxo acid dehydrogenase subunit E2 [Sedimentisphaerales bacterium]|nr:2-oxo acid dehydrogenase subunit E2 [Sedimentisphaerales bacterium]